MHTCDQSVKKACLVGVTTKYGQNAMMIEENDGFSE